MTIFIDSHLRCPRDGKRLVVDIGPDENDGVISIGHDCLNCGWHEEAPRTVAEARHSDVPQVRAVHESLREALLRQRLEGVVVAMKYDDEPVEVEW